MIRSGGQSKITLLGRRMFILSAAKAIVVFGIVGRLISLQINESKKYKTLSDKNRFREWKFSPPRGLINDFYGKEIASNKQVYQLHIIPENSENLELLLFRLKTILKLTDKNIVKIKRVISKQKPWDPVIISDNLSWSDFSRINLFLHDLQGVEPVVSVARLYTEPSSSHVIGYVSKASKRDLKTKDYLQTKIAAGTRVGKTGLESSLDKEVIGTYATEEGCYHTIRDAHARHVKEPTRRDSWIPHTCETWAAPACFALHYALGLPAYDWGYDAGSMEHAYPVRLSPSNPALRMLAPPARLEEVCFTEP